MCTISPQSLGGQANAKLQRAAALQKYYEKPNECKLCGIVIRVGDNQKVAVARKAKFCSRSCNSKYTNAERWVGHVKKPKHWKRKLNAKPKVPPYDYLTNQPKEEFFVGRKNYQSARSCIQQHARHVYQKSSKPKMCCICSYQTHYEVCHLKSVSDFDGRSLIVDEINHIDNLVAMCPTHHWELDNGVIDKKLLKT